MLPLADGTSSTTSVAVAVWAIAGREGNIASEAQAMAVTRRFMVALLVMERTLYHKVT
jgi:hypothetical protein